MAKSVIFEKTKGLMRDFVFGMQDGLISNLGLVLGVWQGGGSKSVILLAGFASMFAGAFSMASGSYLSAKSQREVYENEIRCTKDELKKNPQKCLMEMKTILKSEGFDSDEIKALLHHFEKHNRSTFMINYIQKKLGLSEERLDLPLKNAFTMFLSFLVGSAFPILPFIFLESAAIPAIVLTMGALFLVGLIKSAYTKLNWLRSGLEIVVIGLGAGFIGFVVGSLFGG
jgi:vacuolar iron transporter family protein